MKDFSETVKEVKSLPEYKQLKVFYSLLEELAQFKSNGEFWRSMIEGSLIGVSNEPEFVIEKDVPLKRNGSKTSNLRLFIEKMEINDSIRLSTKYYNQVHAFATQCKITLIRRKINDLEFRIHRVK